MKPFPSLRRVAAMAVLALSLGALAVPAAFATQLKKQNLTQLISQSDSIIAGTVIKVSDGLDAKGVPYTEVTIAVGDAAKGKIAREKNYTFRQFGLLAPRDLPNGHKLLALSPEAFPRWREGEYVVAFLYRAASLTGLRTTVGLAQGKLTSTNNRLANEFNNAGLFADVDVDASLLSPAENAMLKSSGPVDLRTFMALVGRAVSQQWIEKGKMK